MRPLGIQLGEETLLHRNADRTIRQGANSELASHLVVPQDSSPGALAHYPTLESCVSTSHSRPGKDGCLSHGEGGSGREGADGGKRCGCGYGRLGFLEYSDVDWQEAAAHGSGVSHAELCWPVSKWRSRLCWGITRWCASEISLKRRSGCEIDDGGGMEMKAIAQNNRPLRLIDTGPPQG